MAKLHDYYKSDVVNELSKQFGLQDYHASPSDRENHPEHGCW